MSDARIVERVRTPWVSTVTLDAIQHFVWGIGDDNPLWVDPGRTYAPPCFFYAIDETTVAPGFDDQRRIYRSVAWTWFDRAPLGTDVVVRVTQTDETELAGRLEQRGRVEFLASEQLIATAETTCVRSKAAPIAIADRPELRYAREQLEEIERTILGEQRQGSAPLPLDTIAVGDTVGPLLKGPLSIMDVVAWCAGTQGVVTAADDYSEGGLHAQTATGPQQVAWMSQLITDWMGDDGFLQRLNVEILANPPLGSTTAITAIVADRIQDTVMLNLTATDQSGATTAEGSATVLRTYRGQPPRLAR